MKSRLKYAWCPICTCYVRTACLDPEGGGGGAVPHIQKCEISALVIWFVVYFIRNLLFKYNAING